MKKLAASGFLFIAMFCTLHVFSQRKKAPFKILIVTPDTASVDPELAQSFNRLEQHYRQAFYRSNAQLAAETEVTKNKKKIAQLDWQFNLISSFDTKFSNLKFYHMISKFASLSISERIKINDKSSIAEVTLDKGPKRMLYDSLPFDSRWQYLLKYNRLSAKKNNESIEFSGTISLLEIKTNRVLLEKDFIGESNGTSSCNGLAECAMINFVNTSSTAVVDFILSNTKR